MVVPRGEEEKQQQLVADLSAAAAAAAALGELVLGCTASCPHHETNDEERTPTLRVPKRRNNRPTTSCEDLGMHVEAPSILQLPT